MTPSEELEMRKRQLRAREGKDGYKLNCIELRKRITELERQEAFISKVADKIADEIVKEVTDALAPR